MSYGPAPSQQQPRPRLEANNQAIRTVRVSIDREKRKRYAPRLVYFKMPKLVLEITHPQGVQSSWAS